MWVTCHKCMGSGFSPKIIKKNPPIDGNVDNSSFILETTS